MWSFDWAWLDNTDHWMRNKWATPDLKEACERAAKWLEVCAENEELVAVRLRKIS